MKYNFDKLLEIPKYLSGTTGEGIKPLIDLTDLTRDNRYNNKLGWSGADRLWLTSTGQYDFEKMYQDYLQNKGSFNLTGIIATPDWETATNNKKGFLDWNTQYNNSGLNKYFGYSASLADYYGPTTAARKAFLDFIKQKEASALQPIKPSAENNNSVVDNDEEPKEQIITKNETPTEELVEPQRDSSPWTDWAPLSMLLFGDLRSANILAKLQKQKKFPLVEAPYLLHTITNNYGLRSQMNQNANDLRALGAYRSRTSDLDTNLDNMRQYDIEASKLENQATLIGAETEAKERQVAENTRNLNAQASATAANKNAQSNAAAYNNILDAEARRMLSRTLAINEYIGNMYSSRGEWLRDQKLNDSEFARGKNEYLASLDQQKALKEYSDLETDFTKSKAYNDFIGALKGDLSELILADPEDINNLEKLKQYWLGDSSLAKEYRSKYETELNNAYNTYIDRYRLISNRLKSANLMLPSIVNNQGLFYGQNIYTPQYKSIFKKGGKVAARYIDYLNHRQKEQLSVRKEQQKANENANKKLTAELDRLSKEQLILLRSIFK